MRALITGGAGFIGSHLAERLLNAGYEISIIDDLSTGTKENLGNCMDKIEFIEGNIIDSGLTENLIKKSDIVFHMAAAVGVKNIIDHPIKSLQTNFNGSENVLLASAKYSRRLFIASTSEVYGKNPNQPLSESHDRVVGPPQKLRWTYSDAKALEESLAYALFLDQKLSVTTLRFFNTVGPRQTGMYGMVVPKFVRAALDNQPLEVHGDGTQSRVFCHVDDVLDVVMQMINNDSTIGEVYNIGGVGEISILELAERVIERTGSKSSIKIVPYESVYNSTFEDMQRRVPNIAKVSNLLNWQPTRDLNQIIDSIAAGFSKIN